MRPFQYLSDRFHLIQMNLYIQNPQHQSQSQTYVPTELLYTSMRLSKHLKFHILSTTLSYILQALLRMR